MLRIRRRPLLAGLMACLLLAAFVLRGRVQALWNLATLLQEDRLVGNFRSMHERIPSRVVSHGDAIFEFEHEERKLPRGFVHDGSERDFEEFLARRVTTGLLVIHDDRIVFERYDLGNDESSHTISWSVCKSFVSALVGIAISEGAIRSVDDPVSDYVPELVGSGYEGVPLKHVLQMSSGILFREDYGDPNSDINRMGRALAFGTPLAEFVAGLRRERPSGEYNHYVSMDTQVIGMVLARATGHSLSEYLEEKIWRRIGTESDAWWLLDGAGMEWAFGGLNVTLRDYGRFGRLFLHEGRWEGEQIVPAEWVRASVRPDAPHLQPGPNPASDSRLGYGYQWWIPEDSDGEFMAIGVYGQYIYVYPRRRLVIVKTGADPHFQDDDYEGDRESISAFRAIARYIEPDPVVAAGTAPPGPAPGR